MRRVLRLPMTPKLGLDVLVAQEPHLGGQVPAVRAEQPPVQGDGRQQGQRRPQARVGRARRRGLGEESARGSHLFFSFLLLLLVYVSRGDDGREGKKCPQSAFSYIKTEMTVDESEYM
jgi:hypothetical protein